MCCFLLHGRPIANWPTFDQRETYDGPSFGYWHFKAKYSGWWIVVSTVIWFAYSNWHPMLKWDDLVKNVIALSDGEKMWEIQCWKMRQPLDKPCIDTFDTLIACGKPFTSMSLFAARRDDIVVITRYRPLYQVVVTLLWPADDKDLNYGQLR